MSNASTIILVPFLAAFLVFIARFYVKEGARSVFQPSFLLALATVASVGLYLTLGVVKMMPEYGTIGFGCVGLAFLALSIYRSFLF